MNKNTAALIALLTSAMTAYTVNASDSLQTIETKHARIHFHQDYQAFAQQVASKFEPIYLDVSKKVGFTQDDKIDFLIGDDFHQANGYAVPLTANKIVKVFSSSPRSNEALGSYSDWLDLVISHELAHKIHISAPSRSWRSALDRYFLDSDILNFYRYPRWITEGYATVIETEYTGQGRVNSDYIKAMLQQWAIEGQLPTYGQLNGGENYQANRMAYYQGSAFLVWLQETYGKEKLQHIWRRSTAKNYRDFNAAFTGVFLENPPTLYKKFVAQQTFFAQQAQNNHQASGRLWQKNAFAVISSEPSPSNKKLLQLERDINGYFQLSIFSTADNEKAKESFINKQKLLLEEDNLDVAATTPAVFNREAEYSVKPARKYQWRNARWLDENHVLVLQYQKQDNRELGFELAKVNITTGKTELITQSVRLHDFTVSKDKEFVYGISHFAGFNQLVKVSLTDGSSQPLESKRLNQPMDNLTLSPDESTLALMAIADKHWKIHLFDIQKVTWKVIELPINGNYTSHLRWQNDGLLFSQSSQQESNSSVNIYRLNTKQQTWQQLTSGHKLATHAFTLDEKLIYAVTTSQGQDTFSQSILENNELAKGQYQVIAIDKPTLTQIQENQQEKKFISTDYGIGSQSGTMTLLTGYLSDKDDGVDLVIRGGDPLGRLRWQGALTRGDQQDNIALSVKSHWLNINWFAEYVDSEFQYRYFNNNVNSNTVRENSVTNINIAYDVNWSLSQKLQFQVGVGTDEVDFTEDDINSSDDISHTRLQSRYGYHTEIGKLQFGGGLTAALVEYQGDKEDWQRTDFGINGFLGYGKGALNYQYREAELDDNTPMHSLLNYGGMLSATSSQVMNSQMLNSRLPLNWQSGYKFKQHNVEANIKGVTFFYLDHTTDDNDSRNAYGIELSSGIDNISPILDGLTIKAGYSWYESENALTASVDDEQQFYFTGSYQFK
jgi:hypothetical protein